MIEIFGGSVIFTKSTYISQRQGSNFTKALEAIAVVHNRFFAIESDGNLN
jgi:hypothetical protein